MQEKGGGVCGHRSSRINCRWRTTAGIALKMWWILTWLVPDTARWVDGFFGGHLFCIPVHGLFIQLLSDDNQWLPMRGHSPLPASEHVRVSNDGNPLRRPNEWLSTIPDAPACGRAACIAVNMPRIWGNMAYPTHELCKLSNKLRILFLSIF